MNGLSEAGTTGVNEYSTEHPPGHSFEGMIASDSECFNMFLESIRSDHETIELVNLKKRPQKNESPRYTGVFVHTTTYQFVVQGWKETVILIQCNLA